MKKRILVMMYAYSTEVHLTKDPCSYAYALSKYHDWDASYAYFNDYKLENKKFEKYCKLIYLGKEKDFRKEISIGISWLRDNACNYDVLMLFNYGTSTYRTANAVKKYAPAIKVWCKLDMSESGFAHFYDGTFTRKFKNIIEIFKSRNVDLFTVENKYFYSVLKQTLVFRDRIKYLPNGVSLFNISSNINDNYQEKKNLIVTVGRLGVYQKNHQMLIEALKRCNHQLLDDWKILFIGEDKTGFKDYVHKEAANMPWLKLHVSILNFTDNRENLYKIYAKAKIFCMTSRWEGFPISPLEAMFFGAYPILTNYGHAVDDITSDRKYGKIVPSENVDALVKALEDTVSMRNLYKESEKIKSYIRANYSYKKLSEILNQYLLQLEEEG